MDYSKMSDYEVSKRVAMAIGGFIEEDFCETHSVVFRRHGRHQYSFFEPCTNPSDAWPIIVENGIGIKKQSNGLWCATRQGGLYPQYHENPLRAAMMVFLHMQEPANVQTDSTR